jgi:hypothetical protein
VARLDTRTGDAKIAIVLEGDAFVAYTCGERTAFNRGYSRWWKGTLGSTAVQSEQGNVTLSLERSDGSLVGTVASPEYELYFSAEPIPKDSRAGLYRAESKSKDLDYVLGWIVDTDGSVVGCCSCKQTGARRALPVGRATVIGNGPSGKVKRLRPAKQPSQPDVRTKNSESEDENEPPANDERKSEKSEGSETGSDDDASEGLSASPDEDEEAEVRPAKVRSAKSLPVGKKVKKPQKDTSEETEEPVVKKSRPAKGVTSSEDDPEDDGVGDKPTKSSEKSNNEDDE